MPAPNVHVELVHDPSRHRAVIGWSSDPALLRVTAEQLICEAEQRAAEVAQWYSELLRPVPGVDGRDVPSVDLSALKNEVQRALDRGIQAPLPQSLYGAANADPTIRSAA